ncbi:trigger factor [bacterium]|nr:trigger factor [bacterium]
MKVKITEPKTWQRILEIEIPADTVNEQMDSAYKKYRQQAVLPGFRKGKVPISLIKARFSHAVEQTVLQELIPQAWEKARQKNKIDPIAEPVISDVKFKPDQPLKFKASVEVRPEIQLTDYTGLKANKREVQISEDDVQQSLMALQDRQAIISPSDGQIGETDIVIIDHWKADKSGIPIVGQKTTNVPVDLSSSNVIPEYRQALIGASAGDQKRVTVTYPADHPQKDLAGQEVSFVLKVKEIKKKILPPLDDEFAKSVSDLPTMKAFQEAVYKKLKEQEEQKARRDVEEQILDQIIEKNPFEVPESLVAGYIEALISDIHPGQHKEEDLDQLRKSYQPLAVRSVRRWFILEEICKKEGIHVEEKELAAQVATMAKARGIDPQKTHKQLAESGQLQKLRRNMEEEKTLSFLVQKTQVKTVRSKPGK